MIATTSLEPNRLINSAADSPLRIYQTAVSHLPEDLYVPPQAFAIWLEQFAGPLDFLLYLVKKNNVDRSNADEYFADYWAVFGVY